MGSDSDKSTHILNTSATLLGLCFVVLTSLRVNNWAGIIDEITAIAIVLFMASCILSFLSIRTNRIRSQYYEKMADYIFMAGLIILFVMTILIAFDFIR